MLLLEWFQGIDQEFDLNDKLRLTVRFTHDPKPLTYKRSSQPKISLVDYVGPTIATQKLGERLSSFKWKQQILVERYK